MSSQAYAANADYSQAFAGEVEAPQGASPESIGGRLPAIKDTNGRFVYHRCVVDDFTLEFGKECKGWQSSKDQTCIMGNLHVTLKCVEGEFAGCTVSGFLPHPYPGCTILKEVGNKWLNYAVGIGLAIPFVDDPSTGKKIATKMLPPGYQPSQMLGKPCWVRVEPQIKNGQVQLDGKGEPFTEPGFFGFRPINGNGFASGAAAQTTSSKPGAQAPTAPVASQPSAVPVGAAAGLDDL